MKKLITLLIVAVLGVCSPVLFTGCATSSNLAPAGVYAGDATLYNADSVITGSYDAFDTFVTWEYTNRAVLAATPGIKKSADNVRLNGKQWIQTAMALREAYKASPTAAAKTNLETGIAVIQAALSAIATYYTATTVSPPVPAPATPTSP